MHSWNRIRLTGSACRLRGVRRHELTAVGAMLTCLAVVLNIGPLTRADKRPAVVAAAEQPVETAPVAPSRVGASTLPDRFQSFMQVMDDPEPVRPAIELASIPEGAFARMTYQPARPKEQDIEPQAKPARDHATPDAIVGIWAPDNGACSARYFREGMLPTIINTDGAWAGETFCIFRNQKQTETGWKVVASCSNPREHWVTDVRLTVKDNRLIWTSKRGSQAYTRCAPDFLMAAR
jgi:hypothetical protein